VKLALVRLSTALTEIETLSLEPQEITLLAELDLTAANAKTDLTTEQNREWLRLFGREPEEALQWAFRRWRARSRYMPAILDITDSLRDWHRNERWMREERRKSEERKQLEEARARGEIVEFGDVLKQMREILKTQPEPEHVKRQRAFTLRMQRGRP
jgi:hypothetical protein